MRYPPDSIFHLGERGLANGLADIEDDDTLANYEDDRDAIRVTRH